MFNLNETIKTYNQHYHAKIKPNKTWGLIYLQPKSLAFLNQCFQLLDGSVYYASPFVTHRKTLRAALAGTKKQPLSEALPTLRRIVQQLKTDHAILQRLNWEERLRVRLNSHSLWDEPFNQIDIHPLIKGNLTHLQSQWNTHQSFQHHSSEGLLFLLNSVVEYHYHFTQAHKELQLKQAAGLAFLCLPSAIAKEYYLFLNTRLNHLKKLKHQVVDVLLLRLKIAEQRKQVNCDDVSYFLAQESQRLGLSSVNSLPQYQMVLNTPIFNKIQRAIEKYGNSKQKKQLYRLAWYEYAEFNSEDITVITTSQRRLLAPKALLNFSPNKYRRFMGLFTKNTKQLGFLETQQALLAQLALSLNFTQLPLDSVSITHPSLQSLTTRHQLLQQSLQSLAQQSIHWWQWQQKGWKKAWYTWLSEKLQKNQASLSDHLIGFYQRVQNRKDLLSQANYRKNLQSIIQALKLLIDNDPLEHQNTLLTIILAQLSTLIEEKVEKNFCKVSSNTDSLLVSFKQDLLAVLEEYKQHSRRQGNKLPENRHSDFSYLWSLLTTSDDMVQVGEEFIHYYHATQPTLFKWIPALDANFLRRRLKTVLANPKYSMDQLKVAALSQTEKNKPVGNHATPDESLLTGQQSSPIQASTAVAETDKIKPLTTEEEINQLEERIQQLINNRESAYSFFKVLPKNNFDNNSNLLKRISNMT